MQQELAKHPMIKDFWTGDESSGGWGVTKFSLKEQHDGGGDQQAELSLTKPEFTLDLDSDYGKHGPNGKVHREGQGIHAEDGDLFSSIVFVFVFRVGISHFFSSPFVVRLVSDP